MQKVMPAKPLPNLSNVVRRRTPVAFALDPLGHLRRHMRCTVPNVAQSVAGMKWECGAG